MKIFFVAFLTFILISGVLLFIGYYFNVNQLMFYFYKESATGFEAGGSVIPFIVAILCSYVVGHFYEKSIRQQAY